MNDFYPGHNRSHLSVNHTKSTEEIRAAYVAAFEGLEPGDFDVSGNTVLPSRELPLGGNNPANYPSLKEILGAERFDRLELTDDGPDMLVREKISSKHIDRLYGPGKGKSCTPDWVAEKAANRMLRKAGLPIGSESSMVDADGKHLWSLDQYMARVEEGVIKEEYGTASVDPLNLDPTEGDIAEVVGIGVSSVYFAGSPDAHTARRLPTDEPRARVVDSAEDVTDAIADVAGLSPREVELAEWIAENGIGKSRSSGWTLRASTALGLTPANVRKIFKRMKARAVDTWATEPEQDALSRLSAGTWGNGMNLQENYPDGLPGVSWGGTGKPGSLDVTVSYFEPGSWPGLGVMTEEQAAWRLTQRKDGVNDSDWEYQSSLTADGYQFESGSMRALEARKTRTTVEDLLDTIPE